MVRTVSLQSVILGLHQYRMLRVEHFKKAMVCVYHGNQCLYHENQRPISEVGTKVVVLYRALFRSLLGPGLIILLLAVVLDYYYYY